MHHLHGVMTPQALEKAGISKDRLPRMPEYEHLARGHYALPGARRDFWFYAALALSIAGGDSRLTADAVLYATKVLTDAPTLIQLTVPEGKGSRKQRGFDVRRSSHLPDSVVMRNSLRCVPVEYALTDHARDVRDGALALAISRALALRLTTIAQLTSAVDTRGTFPGSARLRRVLKDFEGTDSHSKRERKLRRELRRRGVAMHPEPMDIKDASGRTIGQADIAIIDFRLDIEVDGPHHDDPAQQRADRRRDRELASLGWTVVRFSIFEIDDDVAAVAHQIVRLIETRRRAQMAA